MDLQTLIDLFLLDVCAGKVNETEKSYRAKLRRLTAFFGSGHDPKAITTHDLDLFKLDLQTRKTKLRGATEVKGGLSPFTIRTCLVTVRFLFSWSSSKGYTPVNPMATVRIHNPPPPQPKAITQDTTLKLLKAAASHGSNFERVRNVAFIYLLRDTGGRIGGFPGMRLSDIDLKNGRLMVTEKGGIQRPLFMTGTTIDAIRVWLTWRATANPTDDYLFISRRGQSMTREGLYRIIERVKQDADLKGERCNPHSFRHAFARDSLQNGAELSQVSAMMGHTTTAVTTTYYARWSPSELKKSHDKFSPVLDLPEIQPEFVAE